MFQPIEISAQVAQERKEREIALAGRRRQFGPEPASSIRRAIGHRFIEFGARLASEPPLESVRSR